jgi:hypothetical protein
MAQPAAPGDQRPRVDLDQVGHAIEFGHLRLAAQPVETVQIMVGDDAAQAALDARFGEGDHRRRRHHVHVAAEQADACGLIFDV